MAHNCPQQAKIQAAHIGPSPFYSRNAQRSNGRRMMHDVIVLFQKFPHETAARMHYKNRRSRSNGPSFYQAIADSTLYTSTRLFPGTIRGIYQEKETLTSIKGYQFKPNKLLIDLTLEVRPH